MGRRVVLWFRNDLRLRDNQLFHYPLVREATELLAVYCLDPRHFEKTEWGHHIRVGPHRAQFLAESLEVLGRSLHAVGSKLFIADAKPEDFLHEVLREGDILAYQGEDTSEEQDVEVAVCSKLPSSVTILTHYGHTLYHRDDLGFNLKETLPIPFGKFKFGICDTIQVRKQFPDPARGSLPSPPVSELSGTAKLVPHITASILAVMRCGLVPALHDPEQGPLIDWKGGEVAALARMEEYMQSSGLGTYMRTRNQIQGASNSSKLSPWLANGCLSPRTLYWRAKEFEGSHHCKKDGFDHVYKFVFELNWRDYFRFYCAHFGKLVFFVGGPAKTKNIWRRDTVAESQWKTGCTGAPLVDALMRELAGTGYIANRGRYIVACYLVHYLGIDWRVGADWFERHLLDHDVCSNYGEWASMANVAAAPTRGQPLGLKGRGPAKGSSTGSNGSAGDPWKQGTDVGFAVFDPWEQAKQYDKTESYVRRWVPELRSVPRGTAHKPHLLSPDERNRAGCADYPFPLALELFEYPTAKETQPAPSNRNTRTVYIVESPVKDQKAGAGYATKRWKRDDSANPSPCTKTNGRRWQPKVSAASMYA